MLTEIEQKEHRKKSWTKFNNSKKAELYRNSYYQKYKERIKKRMIEHNKTVDGKESQRKASAIKRLNHLQEVDVRNKLNLLFKNNSISNNEFICAICGKQPIDKHHENYNLWYVFIPLCRDCHVSMHNKRGKSYD